MRGVIAGFFCAASIIAAFSVNEAPISEMDGTVRSHADRYV
jgi:hypothetical protein